MPAPEVPIYVIKNPHRTYPSYWCDGGWTDWLFEAKKFRTEQEATAFLEVLRPFGKDGIVVARYTVD